MQGKVRIMLAGRIQSGYLVYSIFVEIVTLIPIGLLDYKPCAIFTFIGCSRTGLVASEILFSASLRNVGAIVIRVSG